MIKYVNIALAMAANLIAFAAPAAPAPQENQPDTIQLTGAAPLSPAELSSMPTAKSEEEEESVFDQVYDLGKRSGKWLVKSAKEIKLSPAPDAKAAETTPTPTPSPAPTQHTDNSNPGDNPPLLDRTLHFLGITDK